jgi:mono/diheme cytochrome c family protein
MRKLKLLVLASVMLAVAPASAKSPFDAEAAARREGRRLFLESSCMSCHSVGGKGGTSAPALDGVGARRSAAYIAAQIRDPQTHPDLKLKTHATKRRSKMIQADLFEDDIKALTAYLKSLPARKPSPQKSCSH